MLLPKLRELQASREWCDVFLGYNHNLRIGQGEFYDMKNMSGDDYPILSPRGKRGVYASARKGEITGLIAKDALCYVDGEEFVINGNRLSLGLSVDREKDQDGKPNGKIIPKQLVSMGAYVIILPDKKYVNTNDFENDNGDIEAIYESYGTVTFKMSMLDGDAYDTRTQAVPPTITEKMLSGEEKIPAWIDTSSKPHQFKIYSTSTEEWNAVATTYVRIDADGIGASFRVGDGVTISGVTATGATELNTSAVIVSLGDEFIVVSGTLSAITHQENPIKVVRAMPDMDFIVESGNRLWGCKYGSQGNKVVNEIYASKLGDFRNWNSFQGTAADSYAVSVGTDGQFTGAVTHLGYPIFFKENYMHKIYGNYPSNYQVQTTACRGVQKGCEGSIAIVNEVVYYKARSGIVGYDGSLPVEVSQALGDEAYGSAVGGAFGNKYYVSMKDSRGDYHLFVYDTKRALWHREDDTEVSAFCACRGELYFIDYGKKQIHTVRGSGAPIPDRVEWEAITGYIGTDSPDKKYISRLDVRMKLDVGSRVSFYAEYDSSGEWEFLFNMTGRDLRSFAVPVRPRRADHLRLRIEGEGDAKIYSICKTVEWGSDK